MAARSVAVGHSRHLMHFRHFIRGLASLAGVANPVPPAAPEQRPIVQLPPPDQPPAVSRPSPAVDVPAESVPLPDDVEATAAVERLSPAAKAADPRLEQGLWHIQRKQWGRAQQALEEAVRRDPACEAGSYLADLRALRRCLRQLGHRPRDPQLHLDLGRLYFALELGDEALDEFRLAVQLEPGLAEGYFHMAIEYLFRGDEAAACEACERAHQLKADLPGYDELERTFAAASEASGLAERPAV